MPETFTPKTWSDNPAGATPITAAELNRIETGIESMDDRAAALELGILTPVTVTYAASVSIDASTGSIFRVTATGALTISTITNGTNGQLVQVQVLASGADRVVTWSVGGAPTATVASGTWGTWTFRYYSSGGTWIFVSSSIGGTVVSVDSVPVSTLAISSAAVTASDVGALPNSGSSVLTGTLQVQDAGPTKGYRFRTSGGSLDLEACAAQVFVSNWSGVDFTGTQRYYMVIENGAQVLQLIDQVQFRATPNGTTGHTINGATGVASLGSKNGLTNLNFCGFKNSTGAPTTGTWAVGDLVMDSAKVWWRCSVAGTPGTWV